MPRRVHSLFSSALLLGALAAQDQPPAPAARLDALLTELRQLDAKAWAERLATLEARAKGHDQAAAERRAQADKLVKEATEEDRKATAVRAEMERLRALQKLIGGAAAPAPAAAPASAPAAAPPKAPEPKPAAMPPKAEPEKAPVSTFVTWADVQPIFEAHCTSCHEPDSKKGGLDLSSFASALQGGGSGKSIVPGEPDQSRLFRLIAQQERPFMPRNADPLSAELLAKVRAWLEQGAAEDQAAARAFAQARTAAVKAATGETSKVGAPAPLPVDLPVVAMRAPARPVPVAALQRSPRAGLLAMPGLQQVLLFDAELAPLGVLPCALAKVATVAFSADGTLLAAAGGSAGRSGQAIVFDARTGAALATVGAERDVPLAVAVHAEGKLVALGGSSKRARVHAIADGKLRFDAKHDDFVLGLAFSPDGKLLAASDRSGKIVLWETATGRVGLELSGHKGAVHAVAFHADGKSLASTGADGTLRLWDIAEGKERWRQTAHKGEALAVAFGPREALASCGSDGVIAVYTVAGRAVANSAAVGDWLNALGFGTDDDVVFAGDAQGRVHRFGVKGKKLTVSVPLRPAQ
jgi:hypothetical protein